MVDRTNPWADAGNQAVGALFKHYMSQPSQGEIQGAQLKNQQMQSNLQTDALRRKSMEDSMLTSDIQRQNIQSQMGSRRFDLDQKRQESDFANKFSDAFGAVPQVSDSIVSDIGPVMPVTRDDRNSAMADVFEQFAPNLNKDTVSSARDAMGTANAMRFDDPIQRQLAIDEKATSYNAMNPERVMSPGSVLLDGDNQPIYTAPTKTGGGSYITTADGTTVSIDGGQPPKIDPTKTVTGDLQKQQISSAKMRGLIDFTRELAMKDEMNFGVPGMVKGVVQDSTSLLQGIGQSLGYDNPSDAINAAQQEMGASGIDPSLLSGIFDPNLPALQTASDLLVFQAASALAAQTGRGLSDKDVKYFKKIVGSPQDLFSNQERYIAKLNTIEQILGLNEDVADTSLGGNVTGGASGQPDGINAPLDIPPSDTGPIQIGSDADYDALPIGTQFTAPDGSVRVKQ